MTWFMVERDSVSGKIKGHGQYTSRKQGLQYATDILDYYLKEYGCDIDERDDLIADFIIAKGKSRIEYKGKQFFFAQNTFDCYGHTKNYPEVIPPLATHINA